MKTKVCERVEKILGKKFQCDKIEMKKNNGEIRIGYRVTEEGKNVAPTVYVPDDITEEGEMARFIVKMFVEAGNDIGINIDGYLKDIKDNVYMYLVGHEKNVKRLEEEDIYYEPFLDMDICYAVKVDSPRLKTGSITLTNSLIRSKNYNMNEIRECAIKRLERDYDIRHIVDIVGALYPPAIREKMKREGVPTYVLSTVNGYRGASVIFADNMIKKIKQLVGDEFYILPSSIHEMLAMPVDENVSLETLKEMVGSVNANELRPEDVLTDSVYIYRRGRIEVCRNE